MTTWQFTLLILSASILTMTTSPTELVSGIERLLRPLKALRVPSHDIAIMISIALRFVPTFLEEIDRIKEAQMARGADFKSGPFIRRVKSAASLSVPLVLCALRRADELATAMEARGYSRGPRTYMRELSMARSDYVAVAVMVSMTGLHFFQTHI
jgi:energy-coupling factor transporter transmembrane protein EcfT